MMAGPPLETSTSRHSGCEWHRPFLGALVVGVAVRVVVQVAFSPALVFSDGPIYLRFLNTFLPYADRPDWYSLLLLYPVSLLTSKTILAAAFAQHVIGLATAALSYVALRHWGVRAWPATLATFPVLFDAMQLLLEQSVLSDTVFVLLVTLSLAVLGWRQHPTPRLALAAGLLMGTAATVRLVAEPLILVTVVFCLLVGRGWLGRWVPAVALVLGAAGPVGAYAVFYHHEHGVYALSQFGGESLWLRTTSFVDCSQLSLPQYQRVLCPRQPLGQRRDPTYYGWHDPHTVPALRPPRGTTRDQAMREFAISAIRSQPMAYALVALRDFALNFIPVRVDEFEYDTAYKWHFSHYVRGWNEVALQRRAYQEDGGQQLSVREPFAVVTAAYSWVVYLPGPVLFVCMVVGLLGGFGFRQARTSGLRSLGLLMTLSGVVVLVVPDLTVEFVWRYQLPALTLLPAAAAIGFTALRGAHEHAGSSTPVLPTDQSRREPVNGA